MNGIFFKYQAVNYPADLLYIYSLDSNLNINWKTDQLTNINKSIALDSYTGIVYANVNSALKGYNYLTGAIVYSVSSSYIPIFVDNFSNVWTLLYKSNKIRKYVSDLSSYTEYTLKSGNPLNDIIFSFIISTDRSLIFLCGGHSNFPRTIAAYALDDLDGGNAIWSVTYGADNVSTLATIDIDNDNNIYCGNGGVVQGFNDDVVVSLDKNGNQRWITANCSKDAIIVARNTQKLFGCDYDYLRQFDLNGHLVAQTKRYQTNGFPGYFWYLAITDATETKLLAGMEGVYPATPADQGIYLMDISTDWTPGCDPQLDTFRIGYGSYQFQGDPTGYKNNWYYCDVGAITASPDSGEVVYNTPVTLTCATEGATIYYTTDGSTPSNSSTLYTSPIKITEDFVIIKAIGYKIGYNPSSVYTFTYTIAVDELTNSMLDELALRLEDTEKKVFTDEIKLKSYNRAQTRITNYLKYGYVQELLKIETGIDISSGECELSSLTNMVLNGEKGILAVKVTIDSTDYWAYKIDHRDLKSMDNPYFNPPESVYFYIYNNKINVKVSNDLSLNGATMSVYFIKVPVDITLYTRTELSDSLLPILVSMAEYYCWEMENKQDRAQTIRQLALNEMQTLNYMFTDAPEIIIGVD